ncbi:MAG TPA: hypothetical protein VF800_22050 [Telluria sp.]|jgi:hypothetical protein
MTNENGKEQNQQQALDQGGHAGMKGHGGQQSGGMGGQNGGDLHDVGSGQSGMTGRGGMGGNESDDEASETRNRQRSADDGNTQMADTIGIDEIAEVQQSAQREGMGNHRHSGRGNEQALDADDAQDDLGSHHSAAGTSASPQR